jgi:hypothetical protein
VQLIYTQAPRLFFFDPVALIVTKRVKVSEYKVSFLFRLRSLDVIQRQGDNCLHIVGKIGRAFELEFMQDEVRETWFRTIQTAMNAIADCPPADEGNGLVDNPPSYSLPISSSSSPTPSPLSSPGMSPLGSPRTSPVGSPTFSREGAFASGLQSLQYGKLKDLATYISSSKLTLLDDIPFTITRMVLIGYRSTSLTFL